MAKNKSNKAWLNRHLHDPYVALANKHGYRSRAAYKLLELHEEHNLFRPGQLVVDLGAAPGSWSQVALKIFASFAQPSRVIGLDLLSVEPMSGLEFIQGDFTDDEVLLQLVQQLNGKKVSFIMSDIAPEFSGIKSVDQLRSAYLVELVFEFAREYLVNEGNLLVKVFQSGEFNKLIALARTMFQQVLIKKPKASRAESAEVYLLCKTKIAVNN